MTLSGATVEVALGQTISISEILQRYDDDGDGRFLGTYITLFIPAGLADAPPVSVRTPAPPATNSVVEAPAPPPVDPVDRAIELLKESGLIDGAAEPVEPPEGSASSGGNIEDLLPLIRKRGKYLTFVQRARAEYGVLAVDRPLAEVEERNLRALAKEILG